MSDYSKLDEQVEKLKEELSILNSRFNQQLKEMGLTEADLAKVSFENQPPEIQKLLDEATETAKREGQRRVDEFKREFGTETTKSPSRRSGSIKL